MLNECCLLTGTQNFPSAGSWEVEQLPHCHQKIREHDRALPLRFELGFLKLLFRFTYFYVYGSLTCMHVCACAYRGQKRDPLELQLQVVVSCYVGSGAEPGFFERVVSTLNC